MNPLYANPRFSHAFGDQIKMARDADPDTRAGVNLAMKWVTDKNAEKLLFQALSLTTKPKPVADASGQPSIWLCPSPAGLGKHVAVVMGLNKEGQLRCLASNTVLQPTKNASVAKSPGPKSIDAFTALRSTALESDLIQQAVNAACVDQLEMVEEVCAVSQKFRTMTAFVVVLTADKPLLFFCPLVIYSPAQTNAAFSFTGKVALPNALVYNPSAISNNQVKRSGDHSRPSP